MPGFLRENSWPVIFSVLLHGLLVLGFVIAAFMSHHREPSSLQPLPIDAVVVDSQMLRAAQKVNSDRAEQAIARAKAEEEARAAAAAAQAEAESQAAQEARAAEEARTAAAQQADAAAASEAAAKAETAANAANAAKTAQAQHRAEAAKSAAAAEAAQRAELVAAARKMQEAKQAAEAKEALDAARHSAELKQAADAKKAADDAKKAADAQARQDREAELRRQLADEEHRSAVQSGPLRDQYVASLRNRIQRAWIKPPSANAGIDCMVEVTQVPGGAVTGARVTQCNGDAAVRQSIENAVYRASPLPDPPDPALFERNFVFRFRPND